MKWRYYLRGCGMGVIFTTIIFMIAIGISGMNNNTSKSETKNNNKAQIENQKNYADNGEAKQDETSAVGEEGNTEKVTNQDSENKDTSSGDATIQATTQTTAETTTQAETQTTNQEEQTQSETTQVERVVREVKVNISGNLYSEQVSQLLKDSGVISDADDFNKFLINNEYEGKLRSGEFLISTDATYEEIANMIVRK